MFLPTPNGNGADSKGERAMLVGVYPFFVDLSSAVAAEPAGRGGAAASVRRSRLKREDEEILMIAEAFVDELNKWVQ